MRTTVHYTSLLVQLRKLAKGKIRLYHILKDWLTEQGMSLSVAKSNVVVFFRRRLIPAIDIRCAGESIPVSNNVKFWGVFVDRQCKSYNPKMRNNVNVLRCFSVGSTSLLTKTCPQCNNPYLWDYGSFLLEPCRRTNLDTIQYKCLRIILGVLKSSPTNAR